MAPSALHLVAHGFATIFVGFGINAVLNPTSALSFFELGLSSSAAAADARLVHSLLAVYGVRDVFMGLAIYAAAIWGTSRSLGMTLVAASAVAAADGYVCFVNGGGEWNHWGYAPAVALVGGLLAGRG